ncbi:MAG TPA: hypothetical protein VMA72_09215 [Streptosporangiaceae bacterium]|nr:hypothetical protein [Streptosporangiaceae bacterium]
MMRECWSSAVFLRSRSGTALITSQPPRDWSGTELAAQLNIPSRHLHTQLGEWTRWGFFTRTGFGTYRLNTPTPPRSSTTEPDR